MDTAIDITHARIGYGSGSGPVIDDASADIPANRLTCVIGPNGCGKSTLIKAVAGILPLGAGRILLDGQDHGGFNRLELSRRVSFMAQQAIVPDNIVVEELVFRGRFAHRGPFGARSEQDRRAVAEALATVGMTELRHTRVQDLSGGQRQRVWLAMTLAQDSPIMLLDEPTTFLDIGYQYEMMSLIRHLSATRTVVAVIHDLGQVLEFADHVIALQDGAVAAAGAPREVITPDLVERLFGIEVDICPAGPRAQQVVLPRVRDWESRT